MGDKIEKAQKRKRQPDGSSKPSKRVAIDNDKQVHISLQTADKLAPIIVSTPGLSIPSSISLKPYAKSRQSTPHNAAHSREITTKELLLHSSDHPKLDYTAREEEAGVADTFLKHYVGVYDPKTGKLDLMEARKMVVRGSVRAHQAAEQDVISTNMRELRNALGQTFGTKKARKAIASVTENAISPEKSARIQAQAAGSTPKLDVTSSAVLANMAEATRGMATRDEMAAIADAAKPRPKANMDATNVQDVYTVESLIGSETMQMIPVKKWQDQIKAKEEVMLSYRYPAGRIQKIATNVQKLKILRYMVLLLDFFNSSVPKRGGRILPKRDQLKAILGEMPEMVLEGVKRKFMEGGIMSSHKTDLLITHICAMALLVDNFEVDTFHLREDLKLEQKEMSQYFNEVGAKIVALPEADRIRLKLDKSAAKQRKIARLRLPLEFPKVSVGRRK